jgi:nitric oxide reductase large subunit
VFYGESLIQASFSLSFFISRFAFTFLFVIFCCCCFVASSFYALDIQTRKEQRQQLATLRETAASPFHP